MSVSVSEMVRCGLNPLEHECLGGSGPAILDPRPGHNGHTLRINTQTLTECPEIARSKLPLTVFARIEALLNEFSFKGDMKAVGVFRGEAQEVRSGLPYTISVKPEHRSRASKLAYVNPLLKFENDGVVISPNLVFVVGGKRKNQDTHLYELTPLEPEDWKIFRDSETQIIPQAQPIYDLAKEIISNFGLLVQSYHPPERVHKKTNFTEIKREDFLDFPGNVPIDIFGGKDFICLGG